MKRESDLVRKEGRGGFVALANHYVKSKVDQAMRPDARRLGGPAICRNGPPSDFESAMSHFRRRG